MAGKLKSISDRTPWSLLSKAVAFGAAWFFLPFWLFSLFALFLYFVPFFEPRRLFVPFILTLYFSAIFPATVLGAALLGVLFFLTIGVKDLLLVRRVPAYSALVILLLFLALLRFFGGIAAAGGFAAVLTGLLPAGMFFILLYGLLRYAVPEVPRPQAALASGIAAFVAWQVVSAAAFLPANAFFQSALALVAAVVLLEFGLEYAHGRALDRRSALVRFSVFFALEVLLLFIVPWGI